MMGKKWKSRRGASIALALLVLLVCATAGTAALTAAAANAGRYTHMRQDQQRYLAASSAAKVIRSELAGQSFSVSARLTRNSSYVDPETGETVTGVVYLLEPADQAINPVYTGAFSDWLTDDLSACFQAGDIPESWWDQAGLSRPAEVGTVKYTGLRIEAGDDGDEPLLRQVRWELSLDGDYTITARFWVEDDGAEYYPTVLTLPATKTEDTQTERVGVGQRWVTTKTVTVTWNEADATIVQG